ncbi:MAG: ATP-grasp domain-containing protein [Planctomycetota bacterium]
MEINYDQDAKFLSQWYLEDSPEAVLLCEYPSSNSNATVLRNSKKHIIHDPFPPPNPSLLKTLGPHHLMFGWGDELAVTSQIPPSTQLTEHWEKLLGSGATPIWNRFSLDDHQSKYLVLFPHEAIAAEQQWVDPDVNYQLHSKEVIANIDCPQPKSLPRVEPPCMVKLSHGYAGLGNYLVRSGEDVSSMNRELSRNWPNAKLVVTEVIERIVGDFGVQFYLKRDGSVDWLGVTEQHFDKNGRWCGGRYNASSQKACGEKFKSIILAVSKYLHQRQSFGVIGIDILETSDGDLFLVDVNPRLTGITPFVMAARCIEKANGFQEGLYCASCKFPGSARSLLSQIESSRDEVKLAVLSFFEDPQNSVTVCHLAAYSNCPEANIHAIRSVLNTT